MRYSAFSLFKNALLGHKHWGRAWGGVDLKDRYDVVIVGGGGHGLACAYYLSKHHNVGKIAVLEKGWIGSGNVGRNTTIIRSNYMLEGNIPFYELSMKLWEGLESDINFNAMVSQRGVLNLCHSDAQYDAFCRRGNAMRVHGVDSEILDVDGVLKLVPELEVENARFCVKGGLLQPRGGTVRHDAVAWGYARAASRRGVDIIENCEVLGFVRDSSGCVEGVETSLGLVKTGKVGLCVAGNSSRLADMVDVKLPLESHVLQAFVTESVKPLLDTVLTFGAGHLYISQSDKGSLVFGGDLDGYNSYAQRGSLPLVEHIAEDAMAILPMLGRLRILRSWGGIMDMSMDGSPVMDRMPVEGIYINTGWCYGGFKAVPAAGWCFAHLLAKGESHDASKAYRWDRFERGFMIDEKGVGARPASH